MKRIVFKEIDGNSFGFYGLLAILGLVILLGLGAAFYMEHNGHYVTGMTNQIVWGMPHVFAIFLILAASGALNIASVRSVFGRTAYHPLTRLSGLLAITLLIGGLCVLVLDLGRPDRLVVAMVNYNFKSIFAWNIILYNGFIAITGIYLWMMMERRMYQYYRYAGIAAFAWRFILTTGTGSIFGFLVAREAYNSAILAPMFIVLSLELGLAAFILVLIPTFKWTNRPLGDAILQRMKRLLATFIAAVFYLLLVYHVTNLYVAQRHGVEYFFIANGGIYTALFWWGQIFVATLVPFVLLALPKFSKSVAGIMTAAALVAVGGLIHVFVFVIGGQAYPLQIFPSMEVISSSFFDDAVIHPYSPTIWEFTLGVSGIAISLLLTVLAVKFLDFLPTSLADEDLPPHSID